MTSKTLLIPKSEIRDAAGPVV